MINQDCKKAVEIPMPFTKIIWKSTIFAMMPALPTLGIFLEIYYGVGNLVVGTVFGFGVYFTTLVLSGRSSKCLVTFVS